MTTRARVDDFLAQHRLAMVGVSRDAQDFSQLLFTELTRRGYDVVPVNPHATEIAGHHAFAHVGDITPPVAGALVITPPSETDAVVHECVDAGIRRVWLHRGGGAGAVTPTAVEYCQEHGVAVVADECPYMFLPDTQFVHRAHGWFKRLTGNYPA